MLPSVPQEVASRLDGSEPSIFDGWQTSHAGEREVKKALRQTLFRYRLHQDQELFERAYGYIRQHY